MRDPQALYLKIAERACLQDQLEVFTHTFDKKEQPAFSTPITITLIHLFAAIAIVLFIAWPSVSGCSC